MYIYAAHRGVEALSRVVGGLPAKLWGEEFRGRAGGGGNEQTTGRGAIQVNGRCNPEGKGVLLRPKYKMANVN